MEMATVSLAAELLAKPSITPADAGCQTMLAERLSKAGFQCESMRFEDVDNLWARYGQAHPLVVFAGHTDVVSTGPLENWSSPPFDPMIRDGKLYGRGACDMKGAIAAMVIAAEQFIQEHPHFNGSIAFLLTSDEEGPALHGTKRVIDVLQNRQERIDYCIIGEPSSDKQTGDQIRIGRRGSLHGKLIVHGKQGHVAHPHLAENPIHRCLQALHELAHTTWDQGNQDFPPTTFQLTNIHSGTGAANVIPGHVDVLFNFRFSTAITVEELKKRTEAIFKQHHLSADIEWTIGAQPFLTKRGKLIQAVQKAIKETTDIDTRLSTGGGTSDGRFIAPTGAEVVELGVSHATAHHIDEHVGVNDLNRLTHMYRLILKELFF